MHSRCDILELSSIFTHLYRCEFVKEEMEYLGFDVGYGWWKPAASKMQPLQDMKIRNGTCNFYRHHLHNFTYSSPSCVTLQKRVTPGGGPPKRNSGSMS